MKIHRILFSLLAVSMLLSCNADVEEKKETFESSEKTHFDFLVGDWVRVNNNGDQITYESWSRINKSKLSGMGWTIEKTDTVFQEDMLIQQVGDEWYLVVSGIDEDETPFLITDNQMDSFTCQNDQNEFPKKIVYSYNDSLLSAVISADTMAVLFHFKHLN